MASEGSAAATSRVRLVCFIAGVWVLAWCGLLSGHYPRTLFYGNRPSYLFLCAGIHTFGVALLLMWREKMRHRINVWVQRFFLPSALLIVGTGVVGLTFLLSPGGEVIKVAGALLRVLFDSLMPFTLIPDQWISGLSDFAQATTILTFLFLVYMSLSWVFETFVAPRAPSPEPRAKS